MKRKEGKRTMNNNKVVTLGAGTAFFTGAATALTGVAFLTGAAGAAAALGLAPKLTYSQN
jgi:hypothetical protein